MTNGSFSCGQTAKKLVSNLLRLGLWSNTSFVLFFSQSYLNAWSELLQDLDVGSKSTQVSRDNAQPISFVDDALIDIEELAKDGEGLAIWVALGDDTNKVSGTLKWVEKLGHHCRSHRFGVLY